MHKRLLCALCARDVVCECESWEDVERRSSTGQGRAGKVPSAGPRVAGRRWSSPSSREPVGCTFSRPLVSLRSV